MMSSDTDALFTAIASAQGVMKNAVKGNDNPFFKSKYTSLATAIDTAREILCNHGLFISHIIEGDNLITLLGHNSGQWLSSSMLIKPDKEGLQAYGSALSYARRYSYMAIVGIASEDDDGNGAVQSHSKVQDAISRPSQPKIQNFAPQKKQDQDLGFDSGPPIESYAQEQGPHMEAPLFDEHPLADEICQVGKRYKGISFGTIGKKDLQSYAQFLETSADSSGKPLTGAWLDFVTKAHQYIQGK